MVSAVVGYHLPGNSLSPSLSHYYFPPLFLKLLNDSVAQLVRTWHLPSQGFGLLPESLSFFPTFFFLLNDFGQVMI